MNPILMVVAGTLIVGTAAGVVAYQFLDSEAPAKDACRNWPLQEKTGNGRVRIQIDNDGPAQTIVACVVSSGHDKIASRTVTLPAYTKVNVDFDVPRGTHWAQVEAETAVARGNVQLWLCDDGAALVPVELSEQSIGISSGDCIERDGGQAASQDQSVIPLGELRGPAGPAIGFGFGAASLTALAIVFRSKLHYFGFLLFSRMAGPQVLQLEARARIHQLVTQEPGIHASAIADRLDLAQGEAMYHLHVLVREKVLVRVGNWGLRSFFVAGRWPPQQMRAMAALRSGALERMYKAVRTNPGATLQHVAHAAGYSVGRASRLTRRLEEVGLVERRASGRSLLIVPRQGADALLVRAN